MPPARTVTVPDRGEFFLRDSGGDGEPVMLLHGWIATADLNWWPCYGPLIDAGYRVLAIDHRGHGRGLRPHAPFRLVDCAADAAAVMRTLDVGPAYVVGYSMGGTIAQLIGRDHPDVARGIVLSGTAQHWQEPRSRREFRLLGLVGLMLRLAPQVTFNAGLKRSGVTPNERTAYLQSELSRHSVTHVTEAGRELGRFDSRPWIGAIEPPVAVLVTTRDELVSPRRQRALAEAAGAQVLESPITHIQIGRPGNDYPKVLLEAIAALVAKQQVKAA
jgi:3-oxoadipate enol-lactonase